MHKDLHSCSEETKCYVGPESRKLKAKDWVKFAHDLAKGRSSGRQEDIIARYIDSWKELHGPNPPMENSLPKRFVDDPDYHPEADVPWFTQGNSHQPVEIAAGTEGQNPASELSRSKEKLKSKSNFQSKSGAEKNFDPVRKSLGHVSFQEHPSLHPLIQHLKVDHFQLDMSYPTPGIKGGFLDGYSAYLESPACENLRVAFIIAPDYRLTRGYQGDSAFSVALIGTDDYNKIHQACSTAIHKDKDQKACKPGHIRCFMNSWVRVTSLS
jgi:hypothetical protein